MNFSLVDNQHGTLAVTAIDATGAPAVLPADAAAVSSDAAIATVAPIAGFPGTFLVTAVKAGTAGITVTGTNAAGIAISTTFSFTITGGPAVGFTATLFNVANN